MNIAFKRLHNVFHEVLKKMEGQKLADPGQAIRVALSATVATFSKEELVAFCNGLCELSFVAKVEQELKGMLESGQLDAGLQEDDDDFDPDSIRVGKPN
jgi:hypothetical protein